MALRRDPYRALPASAPSPAALCLQLTASHAHSDRELLEEVAQGGREALGSLYDRYAPRLLGLAQRMLGSRREAEDLVHDLFLEVWQHAASYDPARASVGTWLWMRARSRALDRLRHARRSLTSLAIDDELLGREPAREPDAGSLRDAEALRGIVSRLPSEQRAVLELGFFDGLSYAEIGLKLAIPLGTVKSRMARALGRMRGLLRGIEGMQR